MILFCVCVLFCIERRYESECVCYGCARSVQADSDAYKIYSPVDSYISNKP